MLRGTGVDYMVLWQACGTDPDAWACVPPQFWAGRGRQRRAVSGPAHPARVEPAARRPALDRPTINPPGQTPAQRRLWPARRCDAPA